MKKILKLEYDENIQTRLEQGEQIEEELISKMEEFRLAGGYNQTETIGTTLHGLGFQQDEWQNSIHIFPVDGK